MKVTKRILSAVAILLASNGAFAAAEDADDFASMRFEGFCEIVGTNPDVVIGDFSLDLFKNQSLLLKAKEVDDNGKTVMTNVHLTFRSFDELSIIINTSATNADKTLGRAALDQVVVGNQLHAILPLVLGGQVDCQGRVRSVKQ